MTKTFIGEILESYKNEFAGRDGEMIETWKISVQLSEEKGVTFDVAPNNEIYAHVASCKPGDKVRIEATPTVKPNGFIKYRLDLLDIV